MENNDKYVKAFEIMTEKCKDNNIMIPTYCFKTDDEKINYVVKEYFEDKKTYLSTGVWPSKKFLQRDMIWEYYYYLKITDCTLKLDNYLDFNYDTDVWTREELERTMNKYGKKVLFKLAVYLELKPGKSFDEWYQEELNNKDLKLIEQAMKEVNEQSIKERNHTK